MQGIFHLLMVLIEKKKQKNLNTSPTKASSFNKYNNLRIYKVFLVKLFIGKNIKSILSQKQPLKPGCYL